MALTKFLVDVNNIQALSDRPNETDGLDSSQLKEKFDKAGSDIKSYLNNTLTAELDLALATLNQYMQNERAQEYPVGKIVMFYDNNDHSDYLGFTWKRCMIGKVPVGVDSSDTDFNLIGKTGGEKTHKLTINEMPNHNHPGSYWIQRDGYGNINVGSTSGANRANISASGYAGGNQPHNNLQPYEVVSYWRRVS